MEEHLFLHQIYDRIRISLIKLTLNCKLEKTFGKTMLTVAWLTLFFSPYVEHQ